jgi:hypothetical protein
MQTWEERGKLEISQRVLSIVSSDSSKVEAKDCSMVKLKILEKSKKKSI